MAPNSKQQPKTVEEHRKVFEKGFVLGGLTKWGTRRRMKKPYKSTGQRPARVYWAHLTDDEWKKLPQHSDWKGFEGQKRLPKKPDRHTAKFKTEETIKEQTQDPLIALVKLLASHHAFMRNNALDKAEREFLPSLAQTTFVDMMKLWKGVFYVFWFSDGLVKQHEDSTQISKLVHKCKNLQVATAFQQAFWKTMEREYQLIDKWRTPKFLLLVRKQYSEWLHFLNERGWDKEEQEAYHQVITRLEGDYHGPFSIRPDSIMSGVRLHLVDIFIPEIKKLPEMNGTVFTFLLQPVIRMYSRINDKRLVQNIQDNIIEPLLMEELPEFVNFKLIAEMFENVADEPVRAKMAFELRKYAEIAHQAAGSKQPENILEEMEQDVLVAEQSKDHEQQPMEVNDGSEVDASLSDEEEESVIMSDLDTYEGASIEEEAEFDQGSQVIHSNLRETAPKEQVQVDFEIPERMIKLIIRNFRVRELNRIRRAKRAYMDQLALQAFADDEDESEDGVGSSDGDDGEYDYGYEVDPSSDEARDLVGMNEIDQDESEDGDEDESEESKRVRFDLSANRIKVFHKKKTRIKPVHYTPEAQPGKSLLRK